MTLRRLLPAAALAALVLGCQDERLDPIALPTPHPESAVVRWERVDAAGDPQEILTITGLGHVTWRDVPRGAVARYRISVDQLLRIERGFDDARFADLPAELAGTPCAECAIVVLTRGVGAGERSVTLRGDPRDHPRALREVVAGIDVLAARGRAGR